VEPLVQKVASGKPFSIKIVRTNPLAKRLEIKGGFRLGTMDTRLDALLGPGESKTLSATIPGMMKRGRNVIPLQVPGADVFYVVDVE
jgi:hypothetical protein